jgi:AraC family ethanolamine operon transcriptional activator
MKGPTASADDENDKPAVTVVEITDPTAAGDNIVVIDQDVVQLQSMPLRAKRVIVRLGGSLVVYQSTNLPVRARTRVSLDLIAFVTFGPQAKGTFNGVAVRPDQRRTTRFRDRSM